MDLVSDKTYLAIYWQVASSKFINSKYPPLLIRLYNLVLLKRTETGTKTEFKPINRNLKNEAFTKMRFWKYPSILDNN